jgi:hypothetical protein
MGPVIRDIHMTCRVPTACSPHHRRSADDGLRCVDSTYGPVASGDPHVPPSVWGDHSDVVGRCHDPWSSNRRHAGFWDGVSRRVEGLHRDCYQHATPQRSRRSEGQENDGRSLQVAHSSLQHVAGGCQGRRHSEVCSVLSLAYE